MSYHNSDRTNKIKNILDGNELKSLIDFIHLPTPTPNSNPSWFGFPITLKDVEAHKIILKSKGQFGLAYAKASEFLV